MGPSDNTASAAGNTSAADSVSAVNTDTIATDADRLRNALVDSIKSDGHTRTPEVEAALRAVPRHLFVPDAPLEDAYANEAMITKRDSNGESLSCASVPSLVAAMLDWLDIQPGHRILEIGTGTGYNAP